MAGTMPDLPDDLVFTAGPREDLPDDLMPTQQGPRQSWPEQTHASIQSLDPLSPERIEPVLKAFGHGFSETWDAEKFGLSPETVEQMRKLDWITPEGKRTRDTGWKAPFYSFNELLFTSVWHAAQIGSRTFMGVYRGVQEAGMEAGLHRDIVSIPDAFGGSPTLGIPRVEPKPWVRPTGIDTIAGADSGVKQLLSRVEAAKTGLPNVDAILDNPVTRSAIESPVVDRSHTVPNTVGRATELNDPTVYIDHRFPDHITARRASDPARTVTFDPAEPFTIRANVEQSVMEALGRARQHFIGTTEPFDLGQLSKMGAGKTERAVFLAPTEALARDYGEIITPLNVEAKNPKTLDWTKREGISENTKKKGLEAWYNEQDMAREIARARAGGHDVLYIDNIEEQGTRHGPHRQIAVLDPTIIREGMDSATASRVARYEFAERAESAWYALNDIDQAHAEEVYKPHMERIAQGPANDVPPNLYSETHGGPTGRPKPEDVERAKQILGSFGDTLANRALGRDAVSTPPAAVVEATQRREAAIAEAKARGDVFEEPRAPVPKLPRMPSPSEYVGRIAAGSRTAGGESISTKGKPGKAAKIEELTPQEAAKLANDNLAIVIDDLYMRRNQMPRDAAGMDTLIQSVAERVNAGIVKPGELQRTHETGHGQTAPGDLPLARRQFAEEFVQRLNDPKADPIETAAWIEWRLNIKDHPWTDGVGKTSRALAAIPLMRAGEPLPKYPGGKGFFKHATDTEPVNPRDGGGAYISPQWQKFNDFYHDLVADSRREMHAERAEVQALLDRNATPQEIEDTPLIKRALNEGRSYPPTNEMEGYGSPEWRQNRRVILGDHEAVGYEAAQKYLTDQARKAAGEGGVRNDRRATIVIGPGGAGKSTIMEPLAQKRSSAIIDADDAKKVLPEFRDGVGSYAAHEESTDIMYGKGSPLDQIVSEGGNVMIQKIGHTPASIQKLYDGLTANGYTVDLVHVSVDAELAFRRRVGRYLRTGRINPAGYRKMLSENGFKPRQTFLTFEKEGLFNETADVDVNGRSPRIVKADEGLAADLGYESPEQPGSRRGVGQVPVRDAGSAGEETAAGVGAAGPGGSGVGREAISAAIDKIGERGNTWVHVPEGEIYLRAGERPGIGRTLEIPNVEFEEGARGTGAFTRYLDHIEDEAARRGFDAVYAEQLINKRLEAFLRKRGYVDEPEIIPGMGSRFFGDEATLYKAVQGLEFMAEEPYRLSNGKAPASPAESYAADALDSAGNRHERAIREVNDHLRMLEQHRGFASAAEEAADLAKWQEVRATLQQWKKDGTQLAGRMVTEEERLGPPPAPRNPMLEASDLGVIGGEKPSVAERAPGEQRRAGDGGDPPKGPPEGPPPGGAPPPPGEPGGSGWQKRWSSFVGKLKTGEDVKTLIRDAARENNDFPMARQGDIPLRDLQDVADAAGVDSATVDPRGLGRMLRNDAEVRVAVDVMLQATEDAKTAAHEVKANPSTENLRKFQEAMLRRNIAVEQVVGHRAEWGRTGNVFQEFLQRIKDETAFQKFLAEEGIKVADLETLAKALTDFDAAKAAKLLSEANKPTFWDKFMWYWVNSLISGPITHAKYIVANGTFAAYEAAVVTPVAGAIGVARRAFTGSREGVYVGETMARVWGIVAGVPDAVVGAARAAYTGMQTALPGEVAQGIIPKNNRTLAFQQRPIGGPVGFVVGLPSRGASAIHSFFNFLGYRGSMEAQAYRAAAQRNMPHEQAFWAERQRLVDNPSEEMMNRAIDEGYRLTYINDVGPAAKKVGEAIRATKVGQLVMPFLHIPFNILARGVEGTPIGFLSPRVRADLRGVNGAVAQDQAVARMVAGSAVGAWGVSMIANDRMAGFGPTDPKERAQWLATGHLPYSIRIGDYWYSFNRFGSLGTMLGIYANLGETIPHMKPDSEELTKALTMTVHATGRLLEDEVGMQGLAGLMEAINDPEKKGTRFVSSFAASMLPYSSFLRQTASALDPEMREVKSVVDGLRYHIPAVREGLIPKRDWLGESVLNPGYGGDIPYAPAASAIIQHRAAVPDPLAVEMKLLDLHPAPPVNRVGGIQLNPQLYEEYQVKAGALTRTMLEHFINQPGWDVMPKFVREEIFRKGIAQAHQSAAALLQAEHPEIIMQGIDNKMLQLRGEKPIKKMPFFNYDEMQSPLNSMGELGRRINPENWDRMLRETPPSTNIEDRRPPTLHDVNRGRLGDRGGPMIQ